MWPAAFCFGRSGAQLTFTSTSIDVSSVGADISINGDAFMKILVPVKRVVDYNVKVRVKSDNSGVD
ncbi:MAG: hypothetical protein ACKOXU_08885, partial [Limnohabitans sp.]